MPSQLFGRLPDGTEIMEIRLSAASGASASIITLGAALRDLAAPLRDGSARRVVLGYPTLEGYLSDSAYLGVTVGRHASRIRGGRLSIAGVEYQLTLNAGRHHLHGGVRGFSHRNWHVLDVDDSAVLLGLVSCDGDQGYPGTVDVRCAYRLVEPATLRVVMTASTDALTTVNLAHHSYFSLVPGQSIRNHRLQIHASHYTPFDAELIPTGEISSVAGTPYDFRNPRVIDEAAGGADFRYDMCLVLDHAADRLSLAATLQAPDRELAMEVHTTEPCLVFYDAANLQSRQAGLDGRPHFPHAGLCLEPIRFPDSANCPWFRPALLRPGDLYRQVTEYRFRTDAERAFA
jgi:aldose 1-epimerase